MGDNRAFANEKYISAAWTRRVAAVCKICLITLLSVVTPHGENLVARQSVPFGGDGSFRAPTSCPALPSHCQAQVPWTCPTQSDCFTNKHACQLPERNSAYNAVNLTANIFYFNHDRASCWQALNLTWITRLDDYAGFLLEVTCDCPARGVFRKKILQEKLIIDRHRLMPDGGNKNDPLLFYHDCQQLSVASDYRIELYSLRNDPRASCLHPELIGVTSLATDCNTYPEDDAKTTKWLPYVNFIFSDGNSTVQVHFTPAPHSFGFVSYDVRLWSKTARLMLGKSSNLSFSCTNYGYVVFKRLCSRKYGIEIHAFGGNCPCYGSCDDCVVGNEFLVLGSTYPCASEILVETQPLKIATPYPYAAAAASRETTTSSISTENTTVVIGSVVLAAVLIGAVIMYVTLSRNSKGANGPLKKKQRVLLIYAKDNAYHCNVVQCLALYLQQCCYCEVRFDQWFQDEIGDSSTLDWLLLQIRSVENVIVVNSEAGWRQHEGDARNVAFRKIRRDTPLEDFFLFAVKELHGKHKRVFNVAFPYTHSSYFINSGTRTGRTYVLMRHIEDLVLDIQRLSKRDANGKKLALDISASSYTRCKEGQLMQAAIERASEFFLSNPDWFAKSYYQKEERNDSLPSHDHPITVCDSGLGPSLDQMSITSNVLTILLGNERLGINFFYPPSSLGDDSNSMTISNIEEIFESMNDDYEKTITY